MLASRAAALPVCDPFHRDYGNIAVSSRSK
jgi:hypothetical protein